MNTDLGEIVLLNELCDRLGMDTISTSNIIDLAYHLVSIGALSQRDIGFPLEWGDTQAAFRLIKLNS